MNKHRQTHLELNQQRQETPPTWALILGAVVTLLTLWVCIVFLFSL